MIYRDWNLGVQAARLTCSAVIQAPQDMEEWNQVEAHTSDRRTVEMGF